MSHHRDLNRFDSTQIIHDSYLLYIRTCQHSIFATCKPLLTVSYAGLKPSKYPSSRCLSSLPKNLLKPCASSCTSREASAEIRSAPSSGRWSQMNTALTPQDWFWHILTDFDWSWGRISIHFHSFPFISIPHHEHGLIWIVCPTMSYSSDDLTWLRNLPWRFRPAARNLSRNWQFRIISSWWFGTILYQYIGK